MSKEDEEDDGTAGGVGQQRYSHGEPLASAEASAEGVEESKGDVRGRGAKDEEERQGAEENVEEGIRGSLPKKQQQDEEEQEQEQEQEEEAEGGGRREQGAGSREDEEEEQEQEEEEEVEEEEQEEEEAEELARER